MHHLKSPFIDRQPKQAKPNQTKPSALYLCVFGCLLLRLPKESTHAHSHSHYITKQQSVSQRKRRHTHMVVPFYPFRFVPFRVLNVCKILRSRYFNSQYRLFTLYLRPTTNQTRLDSTRLNSSNPMRIPSQTTKDA